MHRRTSNPETPAAVDRSGYFADAPINRAARGESARRASASDAVVGGRRRSSVAVQNYLHSIFYPPDEQLVQPFSFESAKTSPASAIKLLIGLAGIVGYQAGSVLLVDRLYQVPGPPGIAPGVGAPHAGPDGMLQYEPPPIWIGATVFSIGICLGLTSSLLFLADGLRIAGNRRKAFTYVSMHIAGIVLISISKFVIVWRKNHTPVENIIALSLPGAIGRGLHFVTIPRSFSNSEVTRGDFARLSFAERQIMSEGLRVVAAIFLGLWAASWSVVNYDPIAREGYSILASLALNVSAALPATNLRRADIFRRSQTSLISPQLSSFRLGSPPQSPGPAVRPPLREAMTYPLGARAGQLVGQVSPSIRSGAITPLPSSSRAGILASMPMSRSLASHGSSQGQSSNLGHGAAATLAEEEIDPLDVSGVKR